GYSVRLRYHSSTYQIKVENPHSVSRGVIHTELDGKELPSAAIALVDDGAEHQAKIVLGERA
ncbi:MAG TPA: hypothetical protein VN862_06400, partial [Candidatus Acidoferrales bacterium]|nr:hypothetical protein [Candidatus Acidoferrales bacterium]